MDGRTLYEKMQADKRTLHRRTYMFKKTGVHRKQRSVSELSPYQHMLDGQNGVCAICQQVDKSGRSLAIDHDHQTGFVRGLLCGSCNRGLGLFGDSPQRLLVASNYLQTNGK